jgi:hypothetical protein
MRSHRHILACLLAIVGGAASSLWAQEDELRLGPAIVIDNDDQRCVDARGRWISVKSNGDTRLGKDFLFASGGASDTTIIFEPELEAAGEYAVFVRHIAMTGSSLHAAVTVYHTEGETAFPVDQRKRAGKWIELGRFHFDAGTNGYVKIDAEASKGIVTADGVMFRRLIPASESIAPEPEPEPEPEEDLPPEPKPSPEELRQAQHEAAMACFDDWAAQARDSFAPNIVGSETGHFYVYGDVGPDLMSYLAEQMEAVNNTLHTTLNVPDEEPLWPAKMAVFVFSTPDQVSRFREDILRIQADPHAFANTMSLAEPAVPDSFGYVVMTLQPPDWADDAVTTENLVAFMAKLIAMTHLIRTDEPVDRLIWYVQGMSDFIAAEAYPESYLNQHWLRHVRSAVRRYYDITAVLNGDTSGIAETPFNFDAVAHGMVRFLYKRDPEAFVAYYGLLREGEEPEEAMKTAFGFDHQDFAELWRTKALRVLSKP